MFRNRATASAGRALATQSAHVGLFVDVAIDAATNKNMALRPVARFFFLLFDTTDCLGMVVLKAAE